MAYIKYLLKGVQAPLAKFDPRVKDLLHLKPNFIASGANTIITDDGKINTVDFESEEIETNHEGLFFFVPKQLPEFDSLCRNIPNSISVATTNGREIKIVQAEAQPKYVAFSKGASKIRKKSSPSEYGSLGFETYSKCNTLHSDSNKAQLVQYVSDNVPLFQRLVYLAISNNYAITEELMECYELVVEADIWPLALASWGCDPNPDGQKKS